MTVYIYMELVYLITTLSFVAAPCNTETIEEGGLTNRMLEWMESHPKKWGISPDDTLIRRRVANKTSIARSRLRNLGVCACESGAPVSFASFLAISL